MAGRKLPEVAQLRLSGKQLQGRDRGAFGGTAVSVNGRSDAGRAFLHDSQPEVMRPDLLGLSGAACGRPGDRQALRLKSAMDPTRDRAAATAAARWQFVGDWWRNGIVTQSIFA